jgi:DNA-binding MarR family transcriptional regulator
MTNPNDEVRDAILRHLYEVHQRAKSPRSTGVLIRDLQKALRESLGYKQQEVASNLDYLVQKGWVREEVEPRTFNTQRGTVQAASRVTYKISDVGIDLLEGASMYRRDEHLSRINITTIAGVTVVGEGNVVNAKLTDLATSLSALEDAISHSGGLTDGQRLEVASDIATIQAQLQKPNPDVGVIQKIWGNVERVVTMGEFASLVAAAAEIVHRLVS